MRECAGIDSPMDLQLVTGGRRGSGHADLLVAAGQRDRRGCGAGDDSVGRSALAQDYLNGIPSGVPVRSYIPRGRVLPPRARGCYRRGSVVDRVGGAPLTPHPYDVGSVGRVQGVDQVVGKKRLSTARRIPLRTSG